MLVETLIFKRFSALTRFYSSQTPLDSETLDKFKPLATELNKALETTDATDGPLGKSNLTKSSDINTYEDHLPASNNSGSKSLYY